MDTPARVKPFEVHTRETHCCCSCCGSNGVCLWRPLATTMATFMSSSRNCIDYHERPVTDSSSDPPNTNKWISAEGLKESGTNWARGLPRPFIPLNSSRCVLWGEFRNGLDAGANKQQKTEAHPEDMGACYGDDKHWREAKPGPSLNSGTGQQLMQTSWASYSILWTILMQG